MQFKVIRASDGKKKRKEAPCANACQIGNDWHVNFLDFIDMVDMVRDVGHPVTLSLVNGDELMPVLTIQDK